MGMNKPPTSSQINKMIDDCIDQLSDDRVDMGVEGLYELAGMWKSAGATKDSFVELCTYIEREAGEKSDEAFVHMKVGMALRKIREDKHGIIVKLH